MSDATVQTILFRKLVDALCEELPVIKHTLKNYADAMRTDITPESAEARRQLYIAIGVQPPVD